MEKNSTAVTKTQIAEQYRYMELVRNLFAGREKFVFMQTFGCQQNEADSERLCGMAELMGYTVTDDPDQADYCQYLRSERACRAENAVNRRSV